MGIVHPEPTVATVKQLYGCASACGFPGCREPLYKGAGTTFTLNSRVAHIAARSEGGPRWDPRQSAEENRAGANLILLCIPHAAQIDELQLVANYPADVLLQWKEEQLRPAVASPGLTDAQANEAIRASFEGDVFDLRNAVVSLGGEGGRAIGAGGGGGGALGRGALGGPGGHGGPTRFSTAGQAGTAPGTGGGGGGSAIPFALLDWTLPDKQPLRPPPARHVHHAPFHDGLRLTSLYLAECARTPPNGLIYALGAGISFIAVQLPADVFCALVVSVHVGSHLDVRGSENRVDTVRLTAILRQPDGAPVLQQDFGIRVDTSSVTTTTAISLKFALTAFGPWTVQVFEGATELGWLPFEVRAS